MTGPPKGLYRLLMARRKLHIHFYFYFDKQKTSLNVHYLGTFSFFIQIFNSRFIIFYYLYYVNFKLFLFTLY